MQALKPQADLSLLCAPLSSPRSTVAPEARNVACARDTHRRRGFPAESAKDIVEALFKALGPGLVTEPPEVRRAG